MSEWLVKEIEKLGNRFEQINDDVEEVDMIKET